MNASRMNLKVRISRREKGALLVLSLILWSGFILDMFVWIVYPFLIIEKYESICLTIVSMQTTVSTLVITILSFMINKMDARYLGVSVNNFLLQQKPRIFKQKNIIIAEIVLIVLGVFALIFQFYNVVIAIFLVSVFLIIISINGVYEIFLGTEKINQEIRLYVVSDCEGNSQLSLKKMSDLCEQWNEEISHQAELEYQEYVDVFDQLFTDLLLLDESRKKLLSYGGMNSLNQD